MIAEIVKREVELQRLKEREIGWDKAKRGARRGGRRARKARSRSVSEDEDASSDDESESEDDRPSRRLQRRRKRPVNVLPDPRDAATGPTDFFDQLMVRNSKFNPW